MRSMGVQLQVGMPQFRVEKGGERLRQGAQPSPARVAAFDDVPPLRANTLSYP